MTKYNTNIEQMYSFITRRLYAIGADNVSDDCSWITYIDRKYGNNDGRLVKSEFSYFVKKELSDIDFEAFTMQTGNAQADKNDLIDKFWAKIDTNRSVYHHVQGTRLYDQNTLDDFEVDTANENFKRYDILYQFLETIDIPDGVDPNEFKTKIAQSLTQALVEKGGNIKTEDLRAFFEEEYGIACRKTIADMAAQARLTEAENILAKLGYNKKEIHKCLFGDDSVIQKFIDNFISKIQDNDTRGNDTIMEEIVALVNEFLGMAVPDNENFVSPYNNASDGIKSDSLLAKYGFHLDSNEGIKDLQKVIISGKVEKQLGTELANDTYFAQCKSLYDIFIKNFSEKLLNDITIGDYTKYYYNNLEAAINVRDTDEYKELQATIERAVANANSAIDDILNVEIPSASVVTSTKSNEEIVNNKFPEVKTEEVINVVTSWNNDHSENLEVINVSLFRDLAIYYNYSKNDCLTNESFKDLYDNDSIVRLHVSMDASESWESAGSIIDSRLDQLGRLIKNALKTTGSFDEATLENVVNTIIQKYKEHKFDEGCLNDDTDGTDSWDLTKNLANRMFNNREQTSHRVVGTRDDDVSDSWVWGVYFKDIVDDIIAEYNANIQLNEKNDIFVSEPETVEQISKGTSNSILNVNNIYTQIANGLIVDGMRIAGLGDEIADSIRTFAINGNNDTFERIRKEAFDAVLKAEADSIAAGNELTDEELRQKALKILMDLIKKNLIDLFKDNDDGLPKGMDLEELANTYQAMANSIKSTDSPSKIQTAAILYLDKVKTKDPDIEKAIKDTFGSDYKAGVNACSTPSEVNKKMQTLINKIFDIDYFKNTATANWNNLTTEMDYSMTANNNGTLSFSKGMSAVIKDKNGKTVDSTRITYVIENIVGNSANIEYDETNNQIVVTPLNGLRATTADVYAVVDGIKVTNSKKTITYSKFSISNINDAQINVDGSLKTLAELSTQNTYMPIYTDSGNYGDDSYARQIAKEAAGKSMNSRLDEIYNALKNAGYDKQNGYSRLQKALNATKSYYSAVISNLSFDMSGDGGKILQLNGGEISYTDSNNNVQTENMSYVGVWTNHSGGDNDAKNTLLEYMSKNSVASSGIGIAAGYKGNDSFFVYVSTKTLLEKFEYFFSTAV